MGSMTAAAAAAAAAVEKKAHAVLVPFPAQGHINPMMKLAKLLHSRGLHITFVHTEYNHARLLRSRGPAALRDLPDFRFATIPDGLPPSPDLNATQDIPSLCASTPTHSLAPFRRLLDTLLNSPSSDVPPVTFLITDGVMSFTLDAAEELSIPALAFWTTSACGFMGYLHCQHLIDRGLVPIKEEDLSNIDNYLDTPIDTVAGMPDMRLRDFPSFLRTADADDVMFNFVNREAQRAGMASGLILNTFDGLERPVLDAMQKIIPTIYTIGPLSLLSARAPKGSLAPMSSSLWKVDPQCMQWLDQREPRSVVYVNFGSITVMTKEQMIEFACGLADSKHHFLWVIRPDLVIGDSAVLSPEFLAETKERGLLSSWCPQEEVLASPAVGGFLTHSGWNSTIESLSGGVPMLCWPFFAEQQTNCRYTCTEWGVGMEIDNSVRREEVEGMIRELMGGEKGREMRRRAEEWKECGARATEPGGSSWVNFERLVNKVSFPDENSI